ncbi:MAG: hypothetical protein HRT35_29340, partial [Algicola sp.]|nr:hypothetical protein [Algicola sp.]
LLDKDEGLLIPDEEVIFEIRATVETGSDALVKFKGFITEKLMVIIGNKPSHKIRLSHRAGLMTQTRRSRVFAQQSESKSLEAMVKDNKLTLVGEKIDLSHGQLVQHDCSDWDFLLCRAEANGLVVVVDEAQIKLVKPSQSDIDKSLDLDALPVNQLNIHTLHQHLVDKVTTRMYQIDAPQKSKKLKNSKNNHKTQQRYAGVYGSQAEANAWGEGLVGRNKLSQNQGYVDITGVVNKPLFTTLGNNKIAGFELNDDIPITGVEITIDTNKTLTRLYLGLSEVSFADRYRVHGASATNLLPGVQGLQIGIVKKDDDDPQKRHGRVKIGLPYFGEEPQDLWAQCAFVNAGDERGLIFMPQPGDQVLVGFLNDDPRHAVVLGSLYSKSMQQPFDIKGTSQHDSGMVIKPGLALKFNDQADKEFIRLETPAQKEKEDKDEKVDEDEDEAQKKNESKEQGGNCISMHNNGDHDGIELTDRFGHQLKMNAAGVLITDKEPDGEKANYIKLDDQRIELKQDKNSLLLEGDKFELDVGNNKLTFNKDGFKVTFGDTSFTINQQGITLKTDQEININSASDVIVKGTNAIHLN